MHTPLISREDLKKKYQARKKELDHQGPRFEFKDGRPQRLMQDHPTYAGMVEAVDLAVGKVIKGLQTHGVADNTVIFFMSDNGGLSTSEGWPTSNLPLRAGKGWIYEGGIREPFLVRWPGITKPGTTCSHPVMSTDFFPTLVSASGGELPAEKPIDGMDLMPLLHGANHLDRDALYWH